jgi:predicted metal-dependent hydrolase
VQWRRSNRARHVGLRIDPCAGSVIVTLPRRTARQEGVALLATHAAWIAERLAALPPAVRFAEGAFITFGGRRIRIRSIDKSPGVTNILGQELVVFCQKQDLPLHVAKFLQAEAQARFEALVAMKAARMGVRPRRVLLKDMRSRWGSCTADRTLTFSWRLVMAPRFVQDYVIGHEVAHLRHMNHGNQFHALERELTRFAEPARVWLRRYGAGLLRVG